MPERIKCTLYTALVPAEGKELSGGLTPQALEASTSTAWFIKKKFITTWSVWMCQVSAAGAL